MFTRVLRRSKKCKAGREKKIKSGQVKTQKEHQGNRENFKSQGGEGKSPLC